MSWNSGMHPTAAQVDYNREAATYATKCWPTIDSYYSLRDLVSLAADQTILDVGCGVGHMGVLASLTQGSEENVYFVDQSREMIKHAQLNMAQIWGSQAPSHFAIASITKAPIRHKLLESLGQPQGFDVVFAKGFVGQYEENARIQALKALKSLCNDTGLVVCDIPQLAISRNLIYPNTGEHTYLATRNMAIAVASALPEDLDSLRHPKQVHFATKQTNVLVRQEDVDEATRNVARLVGLADCAVLHSKESFKISGATSQNKTIWEHAIARTTFHDQPIQVRVDMQRREWVQGRRSQAEWGHRIIELPLSVDVAMQKLVDIPLESVAGLVSKSEGRALMREWKKR